MLPWSELSELTDNFNFDHLLKMLVFINALS